jgi:hypothetical protein
VWLAGGLLTDAIRSLLIEADSMLSAYAYGRMMTKLEALELSTKLRNASKAVPARSAAELTYHAGSTGE